MSGRYNMERKKVIMTGIISCCWCVFMALYLFFNGKHPFINYLACAPSLFFVIVPLLILLVSLFSRKKRLIILSLGGLAAGCTQIELNIYHKTFHSVQDGERAVSVFNWNTMMWDDNKNKEEFFGFLQDQRADIYVLQEAIYAAGNHTEGSDPTIIYKPSPITSIVPGLTNDYLFFDKNEEIQSRFPGYYVSQQDQYVVISRFPVIRSVLDPSQQFQTIDVDIDGYTLRLFNVHIVLQLETFNPFEPHFFPALKRRFEARAAGMENLLKGIESTDSDYIVLGDFNSPSTMNYMDVLKMDHEDMFSYSDKLMPVTYSFMGIKLWRFDYILYPENVKFRVNAFENTDGKQLSDHYFQKFRIVVPYKKQEAL